MLLLVLFGLGVTGYYAHALWEWWGRDSEVDARDRASMARFSRFRRSALVDGGGAPADPPRESPPPPLFDWAELEPSETADQPPHRGD